MDGFLGNAVDINYSLVMSSPEVPRIMKCHIIFNMIEFSEDKEVHISVLRRRFALMILFLVGCFGFNGPLRQYFSLYRVVSQREGEREERIVESKNV